MLSVECKSFKFKFVLGWKLQFLKRDGAVVENVYSELLSTVKQLEKNQVLVQFLLNFREFTFAIYSTKCTSLKLMFFLDSKIRVPLADDAVVRRSAF